MSPPAQVKTHTYVFIKSEVSLINSCQEEQWGAMSLSWWSLVPLLFGFGRNRAHSSLKSHHLIGQDGSPSAWRIQILLKSCSLPAFPPSSLSTWYGWLWFCFRIRIWKVMQQFVSSSFPPLYSILLSACLHRYGFFFPPKLSSVFVFALLSLSPFLSFSLSVSCFLSGADWTYIS